MDLGLKKMLNKDILDQIDFAIGVIESGETDLVKPLLEEIRLNLAIYADKNKNVIISQTSDEVLERVKSGIGELPEILDKETEDRINALYDDFNKAKDKDGNIKKEVLLGLRRAYSDILGKRYLIDGKIFNLNLAEELEKTEENIEAKIPEVKEEEQKVEVKEEKEQVQEKPVSKEKKLDDKEVDQNKRVSAAEIERQMKEFKAKDKIDEPIIFTLIKPNYDLFINDQERNNRLNKLKLSSLTEDPQKVDAKTLMPDFMKKQLKK